MIRGGSIPSVWTSAVAGWLFLVAGAAFGTAVAPAGESAAAAPADPAGAAAPHAAAPPALHLADALRLAAEKDWDLRAARADVAIAEGGVRTSREVPNPQASVSTSKLHAGGDGTALGNDFWSRSYDTVFQFGQLIEIGGKRGARESSAESEAEVARARRADTARTVRESVVHAYVAAALAESNARIAGESAGYLRDEARIAEARWEAGDISRSDRDQIEIAASRFELDAQNAQAEALSSRIALEVLLGVDHPSGNLVLADSLEALGDEASLAAPPGPGGERPDLAAARAELQRAEADLRLERALRIPDPTVFVQYEHEPPDRSNSAGAAVSFPLPFWNRNGGAIDGARAARDEAAIAVDRVEAQVAADLASAQAQYEEATSRWRRYRDLVRPRSREVRQAVSLAYEKGGASLLDLLEAQRNDNDVRLASMRAASDAAVAAADLEAATESFERIQADPSEENQP